MIESDIVWKQLSKYLGVKLIELILLPLVLLGGSYLLSLMVDFWGKGGFMPNVLPPSFLPILATFLVIVPIFLKVRQNRKEHLENERFKIREKREIYYKKVEDACSAVKTMYMASEISRNSYVKAWEKIMFVHAELREKRKEQKEDIPKELDYRNKESVKEWYMLLVKELARCKREKENA